MSGVVITGVGSINALGVGVEVFAESLRAGRSAIRPLSLFDTTGYRTKFAAEVVNLNAPEWLPRNIVRHASRSDLLALIAAQQALVSAHLAGVPNRERIGIVLGGTTGGMLGGEEQVRQMLVQGRSRPARLLVTPASSSTNLIAAHLGCGGPRLTVSTACSSGSNALGIAADWIGAGRAEAVLCGGVDSLCKMTFSGFNALQALDTVPCRPFDRRRAGLTLGEGAAMFVLESRQRASARGAKVWVEFLGYGVSADAHHLTHPSPDGAGAQLALRRALDESGIAPEDVDYVNAHGTATPLNDSMETKALKAVLGRRAYAIPVSSTKSMIGHCLAAAGAIEALACIIALRDGFVPPTASLEEPDPECDLDYVPKHSRAQSLRTVVSNSYGFGGNNTSIVLRRAE